MPTLPETPNLQWFSTHSPCRMCGKKSDGILFDNRNASYGEHCKKCADGRLKLSKKVAADIAAGKYKDGGDD